MNGVLRSYSKNLKLYFFSTVTVGLSASINLGIITMFFKSKSLSYYEVSLLFSLILISSLILEYPSGVFADYFGRKKIYAIGVILISFKYLLFSISNSFNILAIASICAGVGGAFLSGSLRAWLIIEERKNGNNDLKNYFSKVEITKNFLSILISILIVFADAKFDQIFFLTGGILLVLAIFLLMSLNDNYGENKRLLDYNKQTISLFLSEKIYIILTLLFTIQISLYSIFILFWPAKLLSLNIDKTLTTMFYCFFLLGTVVMNMVMPKLTKKFSRMEYIRACIVIMTISFVVLGSSRQNTIILGMFIFGAGYGSLNPVFFGWLAKHIDEDNSASLISMITAIGSVLSIIINIVIGDMMDKYSLYIIQLISVILGIVSFIIVTKIMKRHQHIEDKVNIIGVNVTKID